MSNDVTSEGERLIKAWEGAIEDERRAKSALNSAECHLANSKNALGKWLVPSDAKEGEKFCVWYGDSLIQAELVRMGEYKLSIRSRGKSTIRIAT